MSIPKYACGICNHDFKSQSHLQRHLECKKKCKNVIQDDNLGMKPADNSGNVDSKNMVEQFMKFISNPDNNEAIELIKALLNDHDEKKREQSLIKYNNLECDKCGKEFAHRQSLHRHKKLNRCKIKMDDINIVSQVNNQVNNSVINQVNNPVINNDIVINNNNTININNSNINIILNVNPLGRETLDHISVSDFKSIFGNMNTIIDKMCYHIFNRHIPNISFYKNNLNNKLVSYLNRNMEISKLDDDEFIVYLKYLFQDLCIQLFFIFKDQVSRDELIKYMKNLVDHQTQINSNEVLNQKVNSNINKLMDDAFRNKDIKIAIDKLVRDLNMDIQEKNRLLLLNKEHYKNKQKQIDAFLYNDDSIIGPVSGISLIDVKKDVVLLNNQIKEKAMEEAKRLNKLTFESIQFNPDL